MQKSTASCPWFPRVNPRITRQNRAKPAASQTTLLSHSHSWAGFVGARDLELSVVWEEARVGRRHGAGGSSGERNLSQRGTSGNQTHHQGRKLRRVQGRHYRCVNMHPAASCMQLCSSDTRTRMLLVLTWISWYDILSVDPFMLCILPDICSIET